MIFFLSHLWRMIYILGAISILFILPLAAIIFLVLAITGVPISMELFVLSLDGAGGIAIATVIFSIMLFGPPLILLLLWPKGWHQILGLLISTILFVGLPFICGDRIYNNIYSIFFGGILNGQNDSSMHIATPYASLVFTRLYQLILPIIKNYFIAKIVTFLLQGIGILTTIKGCISLYERLSRILTHKKTDLRVTP